MNKSLDVYLHGTLVGHLNQEASGNLSFSYTPEYVKKNSMPISLSMPVRLEAYKDTEVKAYFSGILPDDMLRQRLSRYLGISEKNSFALLEAIGGECAGALSLYPENQTPPEESNNYEQLDDQKLKSLLHLLNKRPLLAGEDGLRLSLAGAQDKLAVGLNNNQVTLIKGTSPTTHILKPVITGINSSAHNEMFCMRLAKMVGITTPEASLHFVDDTPFFLVERYDRVTDKHGKISRIHQEDFCQALSIMPEMKYEREGGPSYAQCLELIKEKSSSPGNDQDEFIRRLIFNYIIGNADAHGKNFSFLFQGSRVSLAPAYDLISTSVYPELSSSMAMKIGGKYKPRDVFLAHWHRLVPESTSAHKGIEKMLRELCMHSSEQAIKLKDLLLSEGISDPIFDNIIKIIQDRSSNILRQLP